MCDNKWLHVHTNQLDVNLKMMKRIRQKFTHISQNEAQRSAIHREHQFVSIKLRKMYAHDDSQIKVIQVFNCISPWIHFAMTRYSLFESWSDCLWLSLPTDEATNVHHTLKLMWRICILICLLAAAFDVQNMNNFTSAILHNDIKLQP